MKSSKKIMAIVPILILLLLIMVANNRKSNSGAITVENIIKPEFLQPGDSVGIMTISSPMDADSRAEADSLIDIVRSWGVNVKLGENLFKKDFYAFSASDKERAEEFMRMIKNDNLKAIVFYRGGYGAIRTLEYIDWEEVKKHPKWIVGFSDVTTMLMVYANMGIQTIHGAMLNSYWLTRRPDSSAITVSDALFGRLKKYHVNPHPFNKYGTAEGILVGGNMTLISIAEGTPYDLDINENSILFIEEVGEGFNDVDRYMQQLKKSGKLDKVKALVIGSYRNVVDSEDPWGISLYELLKTYTDELDIPVIYNDPAGHGRPHYATYIGGHVKITVDENGAEVEFR